MVVHGIISAVLIGLVIGALGRRAVPGEQHIPIWLTILVGVGAAFVGTALASPSLQRHSGEGGPGILRR